MPLPQDKVFLGMTRPSGFWGTHFAAVIANVIVTMYAFVLSDSLAALALAIPVHLVCVAITAYDPHAFRLLFLAGKSFVETLGNRAQWRAGSRAPYGRRGF
jgi:type IV secretion system protein VirB3